MREKELRLALVCYGGVSLAVYMHGITKEVWKLTRASMRRKTANAPVSKSRPMPAARDSEIVYGNLLAMLGARLDLSIMVDIVAGASAGGINGILLAQAMSQGHDMEPLRDLWLDGADSDRLLDPDGAATRFSKLWAVPLVWWARRRGLVMSDMKEVEARAEVSAKLSRLMRSRWFRPPFSGAKFAAMLYDAFDAMAAGERTLPLLPPVQPLDLFVTVTDYHGAAERLHLHSPPEITEAEHRLVIGFSDHGADADGRRHLGDIAELAFAARATASFPGAFPPARVAEIDRLLKIRDRRWPGRAAFLARLFPARGNPEAATLIDGAVLNNRPFGPAIDALSRRPSHREVDRRFVYIDPKPGMHSDLPADSMALPGFFATVLRSLADIPRQQPINDSLAALETRSARVRQLRHVVEGMAMAVDAAIEGALGVRIFLFKLTPVRLADWRSRLQSEAARQAGFAYAAYGQLKVAQIVEVLSERLAMLGGGDPVAVRTAVWAEVRRRGFDRTAEALSRGGAASEYVAFLRSFDLEFRVRRLRFLIRRVNTLAEASAEGDGRAALEAMKSGLYAIVARHLTRRQPGFFSAQHREIAARTIVDPAAALAALGTALDLKALDTDADAAIVALFSMAMPRALRRELLSAYLGFPFYDIAMLPMLQGDGVDEFDEIKVDRMSPEDALSLRGAGGGVLKGAQFSAFGAFFSRAFREHDYLWGRLHAAERLIDIVCSALPETERLSPAVLAGYKLDAFRAIVAAEREKLTLIPDQFAVLDRELAGIAIVK
jgi:patatin-related protein